MAQKDRELKEAFKRGLERSVKEAGFMDDMGNFWSEFVPSWGEEGDTVENALGADDSDLQSFQEMTQNSNQSLPTI